MGDPRRVGRVAGLVGLAAGLLVVVAAAGQARGGSSAGTVHPAALRVVGDVLVVLLVLAVLAGLAIWVLVLVSPRRRRGDPEDEADEMPPATWWEKLPLAIALALVALMLVVLVRTAHSGSPGLGPTAPADSARPPGNGGTGSSSPAVGSLDWPVIGAVVVLVVVGVVVALQLAGRRPRLAVAREPLPPGGGLAALQAVGLDELRSEPDPRRAVIRAYAAMGALLGLSGRPRRPSETPFEFLARALVGLGTSAVAARRLTELFERAVFSDHPITEGVKDEAIDALSALRAEVAP